MQLLRLTRHARLGDLGIDSSAFSAMTCSCVVGSRRSTGPASAASSEPNLLDDKSIAWLGSVLVLFILEEQPTPAEIRITMRDYVAPAIVIARAI